MDTAAGLNFASAVEVKLAVFVAGAAGAVVGLEVGFVVGLGVEVVLTAGLAGVFGTGGPRIRAGDFTAVFGGVGFGCAGLAGAGFGGAGLAGAGFGGKGLAGLVATLEVTVDFTQTVSTSASFSDPCEKAAAPPAEQAQVGVGA
jgi:hypothetical protein